MRDSDNIAAVARLKPDFMGFIFFPGSKRFVGREFSSAQLAKLDPLIARVGVFVDASHDEIVRAVKEYNLGYVQLHGQEDPAYCWKLREKCSAKLIRAFRLSPDFDFGATSGFASVCEYLLFDGPETGKSFDWNILRAYSGSLPFFVAGGLGTDNLKEALKIRHEKFFGVDMSSRLEESPGVKSIARVEECINLVHA